MDLRHEMKHSISYPDMLILRQRLDAVMQRDTHAAGGKYFIRSLYFDTPEDKALNEKICGVSRREKFRLRYYNGDTSFIRLEKKIKMSDLGSKLTDEVTADEVARLLKGDASWMKDTERQVVSELHSKMEFQRLEPKVIVDYTRIPYTFAPGNVRVTLDFDIRTGMRPGEFLNPDCVTVPTGNDIILEVKWDGFLPDIIRDAVALDGVRTGAFSKYAQCRMYG